jgi:hypothetical protein
VRGPVPHEGQDAHVGDDIRGGSVDDEAPIRRPTVRCRGGVTAGSSSITLLTGG